MKIPKNLYQFTARPSVFLSSGEYEARLYLAADGKINPIKTIKLPPRIEAREKQGFITSSSSQNHLGAVGHKGRYIDDLKRRFVREVVESIRDILSFNKACEIYLFSPAYVEKRILEKLNQSEKKRIISITEGNSTKKSPLEMVRELMIREKKEKQTMRAIKPEAMKILNKR